jgi:N-methylhydantoinase B
VLNSKGSFSAPADSLVTFEVPGSGGFGPASERDADKLRADLIDDYVSPAGAMRDYDVDASFLPNGPVH